MIITTLQSQMLFIHFLIFTIFVILACQKKKNQSGLLYENQILQ